MNEYEGAVLDAAELLVDKWRAFQDDSNNEDPDTYAENLEKAVDAMRATKTYLVKGGTIEATINPKPSPKVGDHVRLTGVVKEAEEGFQINLDCGAIVFLYEEDSRTGVEVIRQPFKRGEVVYGLEVEPVFKDIPFDVLEDEVEGRAVMVRRDLGSKVFLGDPKFFERRP